jgi:hypothetical protein
VCVGLGVSSNEVDSVHIILTDIFYTSVRHKTGY